MGVSKNIIDILNKNGIKTETISDIFITKLSLSNTDVFDKIKSEKEKLIKHSDHGDNEDIIDLLMDLEINQQDVRHNMKCLLSRIEYLEYIIEYLIDNTEIDLSNIDINTRLDNKITDDMWSEATKQRRREKRFCEILKKN